MHIDILTADGSELLAVKSHVDIFTTDKQTNLELYRKFRGKWHPDKNPSRQAAEVFNYISELYVRAGQQLGMNLWGSGNIKEVRIDSVGITLKFLYQRTSTSEGFATQFVSKKFCFFEVEDSARQLGMVFESCFEKVGKYIHSFTPTDPVGVKLRAEFKDFLKLKMKRYGDQAINVMLPDPEKSYYVPLYALKMPMAVEHVAWIISRLCNWLVMFQVADTPNLGIDKANIFVNTDTHQLIPVGGWHFGTSYKSPLLAAPGHLVKAFPDITTSKRASTYHQQWMIKNLAKELLGDKSGLSLISRGVNAGFVNWLNSDKPNLSAIKFFHEWEHIRDTCLGPRKWVKYEE